MSSTIQTVQVDRPISVVYDQWTQFETFPQFMDGVEDVRQTDDTHLRWRAKIAGVTREWDAEITRQDPNREIAWQAITGATNRGAVTFRELGIESTEVTLDFDFEPEGAVEQVGDKLGFVKSRASADLRRFKEFIEMQPVPTGGWRGTVRDGRVIERN